MSAAEVKLTKQAVADYLRASNGEVTPGEVTSHANGVTGLDFGPTTIAKYIGGAGWLRVDHGRGRVTYRRPPDA